MVGDVQRADGAGAASAGAAGERAGVSAGADGFGFARVAVAGNFAGGVAKIFAGGGGEEDQPRREGDSGGVVVRAVGWRVADG